VVFNITWYGQGNTDRRTGEYDWNARVGKSVRDVLYDRQIMKRVGSDDIGFDRFS